MGRQSSKILKETMNAKNRDLSIEMLKAIAAILVMNSHMGKMYTEYSSLATGGAIGDALFFFCSGYTLFWGKLQNFPNWYKRRIQRIYPTIIVMALINATYNISQIRYDIEANLGTGWFISCIFLYYLLLFPIRKYFSNYLTLVLICFSAITILLFFYYGIEENSSGNIYGATYFKWAFFFLYMLFGAICGKKALQGASTEQIKQNFSTNLFFLLLNIIVFYGIYIITKNKALESYQLLSLFPLFGICYFAWTTCKCTLITRMIQTHIIGSSILFIGSLCLEIYLAQSLVFTTILNHIFPFNIPIIMIGVIMAAYFVRCLSRFLLQTFQIGDYDWQAIFKPFSR